MADHGLFVAGIIHSIAPQASLHLIRVLNDFGWARWRRSRAGCTAAYTQRDRSGRWSSI